MALSKITNTSMADTAIHGRRNLIINGAMQVAQRGTSFTSVAGSAYHLDRYRTGMGDTSARFTVTQATSGLNGFPNSLKYECTTAEASLSNADARLFVTQRIEGQDLQQLKKGTSDAKKVTVSFYVKSTKTGTYILNLIDHDNNRQISKAYTISLSGTWEQKILTFDADTTGALDNDNANSFSLNWHLIAGTNYSSGTLATSWQGYAGASDYEDAAVGNVNLGDSTSNTWEITGVQLEVGEQATPFEHRSFGEELALCQRYFRNVDTMNPTYLFTVRSADDIRRLSHVFSTMRSAPTCTIGATQEGTVSAQGTGKDSVQFTVTGQSTSDASAIHDYTLDSEL